MHGGTSCRRGWTAGGNGLSPRARGNLDRDVRPGGRERSIPACTGEPPTVAQSSSASTVYPRVHGGTTLLTLLLLALGGLSPRARGNRVYSLSCSAVTGSIPACTGEPGAGSSAVAPPTVYPRVHGGTMKPLAEDEVAHGLSPRARGNLLHLGAGRRGARSIPACTGEPHQA